MRTELAKLPIGLLAVLTVACSAAPTQRQSADVSPNPPRAERTLMAAIRTEPFSVAPRELEGGGVGLDFTIRAFNAGLELVDDKGGVSPYLAEALPQLNTDSWRVFPDGRMETRYILKPNLTWHHGTAFSADDFIGGLAQRGAGLGRTSTADGRRRPGPVSTGSTGLVAWNLPAWELTD